MQVHDLEALAQVDRRLRRQRDALLTALRTVLSDSSPQERVYAKMILFAVEKEIEAEEQLTPAGVKAREARLRLVEKESE